MAAGRIAVVAESAPSFTCKTSRGVLGLLLLPIAISMAAGTVANWFAPLLVIRHPLLLIVLNPRLRYLILASPRVSLVPFFAVPIVRFALVDVLCFLVGRRCGEAALGWIERRIRRGRRALRALERWFLRAAPALTFAFPSGPVCLLAGWSGMGPVSFVALILGGICLRLIAVRIFAMVFHAQLVEVLRFIGRNEGWLVLLTLGVGIVQILLLFRPSRAREPDSADM